ncbi:MAG: hypothetical protein CMI52_05120 [Parcubacteria group bacterium]|nr:hypothetical protein [Parcubacteria group bacterium]|tara:strand:- start:626 stop:1096 length:471 start_codon:yes stop_codon:yes gene_type:complete
MRINLCAQGKRKLIDSQYNYTGTATINIDNKRQSCIISFSVTDACNPDETAWQLDDEMGLFSFTNEPGKAGLQKAFEETEFLEKKVFWMINQTILDLMGLLDKQAENRDICADFERILSGIGRYEPDWATRIYKSTNIELNAYVMSPVIALETTRQ